MTRRSFQRSFNAVDEVGTSYSITGNMSTLRNPLVSFAPLHSGTLQ